MSEREYDACLDITAGELKALGYPIPDDIPNCAWVPRTALKVTAGKAEYGPDKDTVHFDMVLTLEVPFRWVEINFTIGPYGVVNESKEE